MKRQSIVRRLTIGAASLFLLTLLCGITLTIYEAKVHIYKDYDAQLIADCHLLWMLAHEEVDEGNDVENIDMDFAAPSMNAQEKAALSRYTDWRAFRVWRKGRIAEQSDTSLKLDSPAAPAGFSQQLIGQDIWRVYSIHSPKDNIVVEAWENLSNRRSLLSQIIEEMSEPVFVLLPLLAIFLGVVIRYSLNDLFLLARHLQKRQPNDLDALPIENLPKELVPLGQSLNNLLVRISDAIVRERQFIDNAAHELKTPLTTLKLQAQLILGAPTAKDKEIYTHSLLQGIDRTNTIFDQILLLSRLPATELHNQLCDAYPVIIQTISDRALIADNKDLHIEVKGGSEVKLLADPNLLKIMLGVLLDNALKHTPNGGDIIFDLNNTQITLHDTGPGIPVEEREHVFERFYKGKGNITTGSGLGLAIAQECATLMGAVITFIDSPYQSGLSIQINFHQV